MAKKSMVAREDKRERLIQKYLTKRLELKEKIRTSASPRERLELQMQLQALPRNSAPIRKRNRCMMTGRPRSYYRDFGLCRNQLREMAHQGLLPGVVKSSW
ncbi:MAG: 30S ribosomal protein S14 [Cyanobacteria bacterium J06641_5]